MTTTVDPAELADALREMLNAPPEVHAAMGQAGRDRVVAEFDSAAEAEKLAALIANSALGADRA